MRTKTDDLETNLLCVINAAACERRAMTEAEEADVLRWARALCRAQIGDEGPKSKPVVTEADVRAHYAGRTGQFTVGGSPFENRYGSADNFDAALVIARKHSGDARGCAITERATRTTIYNRIGDSTKETFALPDAG